MPHHYDRHEVERKRRKKRKRRKRKRKKKKKKIRSKIKQKKKPRIVNNNHTIVFLKKCLFLLKLRNKIFPTN